MDGQILSEKAVQFQFVDEISHMPIQRLLKTKYKPYLKTMWCILPKQNAEFVVHMEDVLEVYSRSYDEKRPVICIDEKPCQLLDGMFTPIAMGDDNHTKKYDCEYVRKGSCSIFMFTDLWDNGVKHMRYLTEQVKIGKIK